MQQHNAQNDMQILSYRMTSLEDLVKKLQEQLKEYVPAKENDVQIRVIHDTVQRIENDVKDAKTQLSQMSQQQDKIQIRVLLYIVVTFISIGIAIFVAYLNHFFH